ncbi:MAG: hypothetical protein KGY60_03885 [Bacteroidales bacterium]|nr:hypothetical protein [Bacteroidales bacterium]
MEKSKYSKDIIHELSELLAALLIMKKSGKFQQAINMIDETLVKHFDFDSQNINSVSEDFLIRVYQEKQDLSPAVNDSLARLLSEKGDFLFAQNRFKESRDILNNALTIYFLSNDQQDLFSFERMNKMVIINEKLYRIDLRMGP